MSKVVIIGNGISGVTAARHIRKRDSNVEILIISAESDYFFSRTALMYIYMGHMRFKDTQPYEPWFWQKNRINLKKAFVQHIDFQQKQLQLSDNDTVSYDHLILAVGSKSNKFGWPGQDLPGVQGLYSYQDLELLEENSVHATHAVIVGGGLIGVELAEMLHSRGIKVTFLVREKRFWNSVLPDEEADLISRHILQNHIDLRFSEELDEIVAGDNGRVAGVKTISGAYIPCNMVGLTAGVTANVDFLKDADIEIDRGIMVNHYLETSQKDVYAIGDCAQFYEPSKGRRPMEQVWYTGRMMGEVVAKTITGEPTKYNPGHWFNSAKFFDIEYQTYGVVSSKLPDGQKGFYWEDATGKMAVHFVFETDSRKFIGINTFGIRLRHDLFDAWLNEEKTIEHVLEYLKDANFDPEFYNSYEADIIDAFNQQENTTVKPKKKSWKRILERIQH